MRMAGNGAVELAGQHGLSTEATMLNLLKVTSRSHDKVTLKCCHIVTEQHTRSIGVDEAAAMQPNLGLSYARV
jgi:hypothetical protein